MILVAAALGLVVFATGTAVAVVGARRRQGRVVAMGAVGILLGLAVLVPAALVALGLEGA